MNNKKRKSDVQLNCKLCYTVLYSSKSEYNRKIKNGKYNFFCSSKCKSQYYTSAFIVNKCKYCDNEFKTKKIRKYCSKKCCILHINMLIKNNFFPERKSKISEKVKLWIKNNPEKHAIMVEKQQKTIEKNGLRYSSIAERQLGEELSKFGFKRHKFILTNMDLNFDVDCWKQTEKGIVWVESDGPYHFRKVHCKHDFEKTKKRDNIEEFCAIDRDILLIRINNEKFSINEQIEFILNTIDQWDGKALIKKLY